MALTQLKFYKDIKDLKKTVREYIIRNMPKEYKITDGFFLKEHLAMMVRLTAAIYCTPQEELKQKEDFANQILYELYVLRDEVEEQDEIHTISRDVAASIYVKIESIDQQIQRFKSYLRKQGENLLAQGS